MDQLQNSTRDCTTTMWVMERDLNWRLKFLEDLSLATGGREMAEK